ncbi:MAG TPA: zf-HC2 domain-containing protein [Chthonomonadaceae bacterium]|nr:zf-HC2 domain-containing protein [Chthonomonadaceae bacterium]
MWNCEHMREQLSDMIDGTLDAGSTVALSAHLEECGACRREYHALKATVECVRNLAIPDGRRAQQQALYHLRRAASEEVVTRPHIGWPVSWMTRALAVATLVILVCFGSSSVMMDPQLSPVVATAPAGGKGLPTPGELDEMASLHAVQSFPLAPGDAVVLQETLADAKSRLHDGTP